MNKYFAEDKIIYLICRLRAKYAKQRCDKHNINKLTKNPDYNYHIKGINPELSFLNWILPPRRKWKKLGKEFRYKYNNELQKINSIEYNTKSLFKTIDYYKEEHPYASFIIHLNRYIKEIRCSLNDSKYKIRRPKIYPKPKEKVLLKDGKPNICRPISLFKLRDKILISQTNKYLTEVFDKEFYEFSHAFRAPIKNQELITHHRSVEEILKYRSRFEDKSCFWVAECDMSKFYDSVSHDIIKEQFNRIVNQLENKGINIDKRAKRIFNKYLSSYNFVRDVLPKNNNDEYWKQFSIPNGEFGWVEDDLIKLGHYTDIKDKKIGIPQGGALSGLIANIVLDYADNAIKTLKDEQLLYIRFCDDMIMIHPDKKKCENAVEVYQKALLDLKLVPHEFKENLKNTSAKNLDSIWNGKNKSKKTYKWTNDFKDRSNIPWIGFVGYEIHFDGHVRVRKSSLKKELRKQKEVVQKISLVIQDETRRARKGTIMESAINRLNGMSVGRIHIWNHDKVNPDMCWVNGFRVLNRNKYVSKQLKQLDKNRNHQLARLRREVRNLPDDPPIEETNNRKYTDHYGKPYSYYHQTLKEK